MKKIAILIDHLFQDSEVTSPLEELTKSGFTVDVIGMAKGVEYEGKKGTKIKSNYSIDEVFSKDYVGLIIPGGWAPDKMRMNEKMVTFTKEMNLQKKPIASICHGGWMLAEADIIKGKKLTSYKAIKTDLTNAGGNWIDEEVVVDGNLITSRTPDDLPAFNKALIQALNLSKV